MHKNDDSACMLHPLNRTTSTDYGVRGILLLLLLGGSIASHTDTEYHHNCMKISVILF